MVTKMVNDNFNFLIYNSADENISVNAVIKDETIWLSQKSMAELFDCSSDNISLHIRNIYADRELLPEATTEKISVVRREGNRDVKRDIEFYNLDVIISVGYRVNSKRATHSEYTEFNKTQNIESDFDKIIKKIKPVNFNGGNIYD